MGILDDLFGLRGGAEKLDLDRLEVPYTEIRLARVSLREHSPSFSSSGLFGNSFAEGISLAEILME
ncbi:hypothetical protein A3K92_03355 [Thermococcus gorgonarius]|uniref:Uncharacterized protein n=1 Tax=Thermococcus gorgonarius TaxID=71997 RepID=A0A2Z2M629_THEGO|nr:hypothetical protein A3K92_03355 [Thermococcus gorgonarius]